MRLLDLTGKWWRSGVQLLEEKYRIKHFTRRLEAFSGRSFVADRRAF
jgi:hypothetical protein